MTGTDPCDEMVTDRQVSMYCTEQVQRRFNRVAFDPYAVAASVWGISREDAKLRVLSMCYTPRT